MMRSFRSLLRLAPLVFLIVAAARPGVAQDDAREDAAPPPPARTLAGRWMVTYEDALLGPVTGEAHGSEDGSSVEVFLTRGVGRDVYHLRSTSVEWKGDRVVVELEGRSPSAGRVALPDMTELPRLGVAADARTIEARTEDVRGKVAVQPRGEVDVDRVRLELSLDAKGALRGHWSYRAHPVTERDLLGGGRVGQFSQKDVDGTLTGEQRGREVWVRLEPRILAVVVTDEQLRSDDLGPNFKFGEGENGRRHVVVFGRNLPQRAEEIHELVSLRPEAVTGYDVLSFSTALRGPHVHSDLYDRALARLNAGSSGEGPGFAYHTEFGAPEFDASGPRLLDAILLRATVAPRALPGQCGFRLNGVAGTWTLRYGDAVGTIDLVRETAEREYEVAREVFVPESIRVRIDVRTELPRETIPIILGRNGTPTRVGGGGAGPTIQAKRSDFDPTVYLTDPIRLVRAGGEKDGSGLTLAATSGDALHATLGEEAAVTLERDPATATVRATPQEVGGLWKDALERAADCAGIENVEDWGQVAFETAKTEWNVILTNIDVTPFQIKSRLSASGNNDVLKTTEIQIGDHAAMLLLRDAFVEMMEQQLTEWAKLNTPQAIDAFARNLRAALEKGENNPVGWTRVRDPKGDEVALKDLFPTSYFRERYGLSEAAAIDFQRRAGAMAIREYRKSIRDAIWHARSIAPCDASALLDLTGHGFQPVAEYLLPRLMKLESSGNPPRQTWVPDRVARARVKSLYVLGDAIRAQRDESDLDTAVVMSLAALATFPLGAIQGAWAAYTVLAIDAADIAYVAAYELPQYFERQEDVAFSLGASAVVGTERLAEAEAREMQAWEILLSTGGGALGTLGSASDAVDAVRGLRKIPAGEMRDAGAAIVRRLDEQGLDEVSNLSDAERKALSAYLAESREIVRKAGVDALTEDQRLALANRKRLLDHLGRAEEEAAATAARAAELAKRLPPDARPELPVGRADLEEVERGLRARVDRASEALTAMETNPRLQPPPDADPETVARITRQREDAIKRTKSHLTDLATRRKILNELIEESKRTPGETTAIKADDLDWLTGRRARLNEADYAEARRALYADHGGKWKNATSMANGTAKDKLRMHKVLTYRREQVNHLLDEVMRDVETKHGLGPLRRKALGSENLTSDYDLSIEGPGAELVVGEFNRRFRKRFGGDESGTVFDTNVYTDPVYTMFEADARLVGPGGMTYAQFDDLRQFMYDQMATAKYMKPGQWAKHRAMIEEAASPELRDALRRVLDEVEFFQGAARQRMLKRVGDLNRPRTPNLELRVTNDLYAETLEQIHEYRRIADALSGARRDLPLDPSVLPDWMRGGDFALKYELVGDLLRSPDPRTRAYGLEILDELQARVANQLRIKQGHALYYASEAYQTEGTIAHVVGEIQEAGEAVEAGRLLSPPLQHPDLPPAGRYFNSLQENRANMFKELNEMDALDDSGRLASLEKPEKAAIKVSKYLVRQLDAAHRGGIDLRGALGDDLKIIAQTVELEKARGNLDDFTAMLGRMNLTPEEYVARALAASDVLARRAIEHSPLRDFADRLNDFYRRADDRYAAVAKRAKENPGPLGPPDPPNAPGAGPGAGAGTANDVTVDLPTPPRNADATTDLATPARYTDPTLTLPEPASAREATAAVRTGDPELDAAVEAADETIDDVAEAIDEATRVGVVESTEELLRKNLRPGADETIVPDDFPATPASAPGPKKLPPDYPNVPRDGVFRAGPFTEIEVGEYVGHGIYAVVYKLPTPEGETPRVIKVVAGKAIAESGEDPFVVVREMERAQALLREAGIDHLPTEFHTNNVNVPYMIQPDLTALPGYRTFTSAEANDPSVFTRPYQEAVAKLFRKIAENDLIWEDGKIDNLYFFTRDNEIVAGIHDTDRIVPFNDRSMRWAEHRFAIEVAPFHPRHKIRSLQKADWPTDLTDDVTQVVFPSAEFFMEKMFEYGLRWVRYDPETRTFVRTKIDPDIIADYFPGFKDGRHVDYDFRNGQPLPEELRPPVTWTTPEEARPDPLFDELGETRDVDALGETRDLDEADDAGDLPEGTGGLDARLPWRLTPFPLRAAA